MEASAGQVLGKAGEPGAHLFILMEGKAQLTAPSAIGEITVRIAGPGESFPLATLTGPGTLITTITALTDARLLAIPRADLLALWRKDPTVGMRMYAAIAEVLANRYRSTLAHLTTSAERALQAAGFWANV
jgi:CRP-like cAMP-binding protein